MAPTTSAGEEEPEADEADRTHNGAASVTPVPDCGHPTAEQCCGGDDRPHSEAEERAARQGHDRERSDATDHEGADPGSGGCGLRCHERVADGAGRFVIDWRGVLAGESRSLEGAGFLHPASGDGVTSLTAMRLRLELAIAGATVVVRPHLRARSRRGLSAQPASAPIQHAVSARLTFVPRAASMKTTRRSRQPLASVLPCLQSSAERGSLLDESLACHDTDASGERSEAREHGGGFRAE